MNEGMYEEIEKKSERKKDKWTELIYKESLQKCKCKTERMIGINKWMNKSINLVNLWNPWILEFVKLSVALS